jgi:hypothetical protein
LFQSFICPARWLTLSFRFTPHKILNDVEQTRLQYHKMMFG